MFFTELDEKLAVGGEMVLKIKTYGLGHSIFYDRLFKTGVRFIDDLVKTNKGSVIKFLG